MAERPLEDSGIFMIFARKCLRCGGILTSSEAIAKGYGSCCLQKIKIEALRREAAKNQMSLFQLDPDDAQ